MPGHQISQRRFFGNVPHAASVSGQLSRSSSGTVMGSRLINVSGPVNRSGTVLKVYSILAF